MSDAEDRLRRWVVRSTPSPYVNPQTGVLQSSVSVDDDVTWVLEKIATLRTELEAVRKADLRAKLERAERDVARLQMEIDSMCNAEELRQAREESARLRDSHAAIYRALGTNEADHTKWPQQIAALREEIARLLSEIERWRDSNNRLRSEMEHQSLRANTAEHEVARLNQRILDDNKAYGCELRDPCGTIWEHAARLESEVARLQKCRDELRDATEAVGDIGVNLVCTLSESIRALRLRADAAEVVLRDIANHDSPYRNYAEEKAGQFIAAIDLPGGHYCDPQAVADAIRAYCSAALVAHGTPNAGDVP